MRISIHRNKDLVDIKIIGEYDIHEVHFFNTMFIDELSNKPSIIALNLKEMTYLDSSAIGSFLRCMNMAKKDNIEFICYNLNERIEEIFRLARLERCFQVLTGEDFQKKYFAKDSAV
jgi:anti-anti-sigma factor